MTSRGIAGVSFVSLPFKEDTFSSLQMYILLSPLKEPAHVRPTEVKKKKAIKDNIYTGRKEGRKEGEEEEEEEFKQI